MPSETGRDSWDVFISYASEDRRAVAEPLARALMSHGISVWFDQTELKVGDSLRERIDDGLARSRFGIVVLSRAFFSKHYPNRELSGLAQREIRGRKVILPLWHGVTDSEVRQFSPPLADRIAAIWKADPGGAAAQLLEVIRPGGVTGVDEQAGSIEELSPLKSRLELRPTRQDLKLIPLWFEVSLERDLPDVAITFEGINFRSQTLQVTEIRVGYFRIDGGAPQLDGIQHVDEYEIWPSDSRQVYCRKRLMDSEIRLFRQMRSSECYSGTIRVSARGLIGREPVSFQSHPSLVINGRVSGLR